jgi:hypothetical protein
MGLQRIQIEGDALEVVGALYKNDETLGRYGQIITDTKRLLDQFQESIVLHVRREANGAAHTLAQLALTLGKDRIWVEDFPPCMLSHEIRDIFDI